MSNILFFIQADKNTGMGHFHRSSELMRSARKLGHKCNIVVKPPLKDGLDFGSVNPIFLDWFSSSNLNSLFESDSYISVIDCYNVPEKTIDTLLVKSVRVMIILDNGEANRDDILYLGPGVFNGISYVNSSNINYIFGEQYNVIRHLFLNMDIATNQKSNDVILYLGSNPLDTLLYSIVEIITEQFLDSIHQIIILKSLKSDGDDVLQRSSKVKLFINPDEAEIIKAFENNPYVVTNLGQSGTEVRVLNLATMYIMTVENQYNNYNRFTEKDYLTLPIFDDWSSVHFKDSFLNTFRKLLSSKNLAMSFYDNGQNNLIGSDNVINELVNITNGIQLKSAEFGDSKFLFDLHNDNSVRKQSFNKNKTTFKEHNIWLRDSLKDKEKQIFIISNRELKIGQIRLDYKSSVATISISIHSKYRGLGIAKLAIMYLIENPALLKANTLNIFAFVKFDNIVSKKLFLSLGFLEEHLGDRLKYSLEVEKSL